jgi:hypothetical protein
MPTATGVVEYAGVKNGNGNCKLDDGNWYSFYKQVPTFEKGDTVSFDYAQKGTFRNGKIDTVVVMKGEGGTKAGSKDVPSNQDVIRYQAARNTAVQLLQLAASQDALPLPAKKADKYDALMGMFYELTDTFYSEAATCGASAGADVVSEWSEE